MRISAEVACDNRKAYVTVITNDKYILGLKALLRSMIKANIFYPLVVLVPEDKEEHLIEQIISTCSLSKAKNGQNPRIVFKSRPRLPLEEYGVGNDVYKNWNESFFKLTAFSLIEYDKIVLIDSDMMIVQNIDHLFEKKPYSAANSGNAKLGCFNKLNSGLMVLKPSENVFELLVSLIPKVVKKRKELGLGVGDQDVIRDYLPFWENNNSLHLDEGYNLYVGHVKYYLKKNSRQKIMVLHFVGPIKPFNMGSFDLFKCLIKNINCFYTFRQYLKYICLFRKKIRYTILY